MTTTTHDTNALIEQHLYLVQHLVNQLASRYPRHVDRQELWSAGAVGLVDAARRYDYDAGVPFARYAAIRIRGAIIDSTRSRDWATRSLRRNARDLTEMAGVLEQQNGREPSRGELADALGITIDEVERRMSADETANLLHLDRQIIGEDGMADTLGSLVVEEDAAALPEESLERQELLGTIRCAVRHLDEPHREVIERHFFTDDLLQDIADDLGITEARVSQIRSEAINAMRAYFGATVEGVPEVPVEAPGSRRRASYVSTMKWHTDWRTRLEGQGPRRRRSALTA